MGRRGDRRRSRWWDRPSPAPQGGPEPTQAVEPAVEATATPEPERTPGPPWTPEGLTLPETVQPSLSITQRGDLIALYWWMIESGTASAHLDALSLEKDVISEVATPLSMAFRHFGNIASGTVITTLIYWALGNLSYAIFHLLPGMLGQVMGQIPLLQVGIPAIFSIYFDLFSSCLQAFIFCMLTMMYIGSAAEG